MVVTIARAVRLARGISNQGSMSMQVCLLIVRLGLSHTEEQRHSRTGSPHGPLADASGRSGRWAYSPRCHRKCDPVDFAASRGSSKRSHYVRLQEASGAVTRRTTSPRRGKGRVRELTGQRHGTHEMTGCGCLVEAGVRGAHGRRRLDTREGRCRKTVLRPSMCPEACQSESSSRCIIRQHSK